MNRFFGLYFSYLDLNSDVVWFFKSIGIIKRQNIWNWPEGDNAMRVLRKSSVISVNTEIIDILPSLSTNNMSS